MQQVTNTQGSLFGRTSPVRLVPSEALTSVRRSMRWQTSGRWTSNGTFWMRDGSEFPSDDGACSSSLDSILEPTVAGRYFLSARAALGILNRAERRGRSLPPSLLAALERVAQTTTKLKPDT